MQGMSVLGLVAAEQFYCRVETVPSPELPLFQTVFLPRHNFFGRGLLLSAIFHCLLIFAAAAPAGPASGERCGGNAAAHAGDAGSGNPDPGASVSSCRTSGSPETARGSAETERSPRSHGVGEEPTPGAQRPAAGRCASHRTAEVQASGECAQGERRSDTDSVALAARISARSPGEAAAVSSHVGAGSATARAQKVRRPRQERSRGRGSASGRATPIGVAKRREPGFADCQHARRTAASRVAPSEADRAREAVSGPRSDSLRPGGFR